MTNKKKRVNNLRTFNKIKLVEEKPMEIGVPINIKHEGHIGFNSAEGGFQVFTNIFIV